MHRYLIALTILAIGTNQKKLPENPHIEDLVGELVKNGGRWIVSAAGNNGNLPPYASCVELTVTDTGTRSGCILVGHNHSVHKVKVVKLSGVNENNKIEVLSKGPIHQYMIKGNNDSELDKEVRNEIDWDTAISSPMCWNSRSRKTRNVRYIITPIDGTTEHLYLVAVKARSPIPEYQVSILTKTKIRKRDLLKMINIVNYRNFVQLENSDSPGLFSNHSLPRVQMACAQRFNIHDPNDNINQEILDMQFDKNSPPFPDKDFKTILVKHS